MNSESKGAFRVERWDEEVVNEVDGGPAIKRAFVVKKYHGEIEGTGTVDYLFVYTTESYAKIYGVERFEGIVDGKNGTFVFEHHGEFDKGMVDAVWTIIPQSGSGELAHIEGKVKFRSGMAEEYPIELHHHLQKEKHLWKKLLERRDATEQ